MEKKSSKNIADFINEETPVQETPVQETPVQETPVQETKETSKTGEVFNCLALYVRADASFDSPVLSTINKGMVVTVLDSTDKFYRITTGSGVSGFCSKQFIKLK